MKISPYLPANGFLMLLLVMGSLAGADQPPRDHQGSDLVAQNGEQIWGVHTGIKTFDIPLSVTLKVKPYDGTDAATGMVEIHAERIVIAGELTAAGAGYTGGGGGGGGSGTTGGAAGEAAYGNGAFDGQPGGVYLYGNGPGGAGGKGDGSFGGIGGAGHQFSDYGIIHGENGGYAAEGMNGDESTNASTLMGSGGGGSKGGNTQEFQPGGSGGPAGGRGGGTIRLFARREFRLENGAAIKADGALGSYGESGEAIIVDGHIFGGRGGKGGDVSPPAATGEAAGGAGGGILLELSEADLVLLDQNALLETVGGGGRMINGGTIKIFCRSPDPTSTGARLLAGRVHNAVLPGTRVEVQDWLLYE